MHSKRVFHNFPSKFPEPRCKFQKFQSRGPLQIHPNSSQNNETLSDASTHHSWSISYAFSVQIRILKISFSCDVTKLSLYLSRSHLPARFQNLIFSKKTHDGREFPIARTSELDWEPIWICRSRLTLSAHDFVHVVVKCDAYIRQAIFPRSCMGYDTWSQGRFAAIKVEISPSQ